MRNYQPHKNNPYSLPKALYNQTIWLIKDYLRIKEKYDNFDISIKSVNYSMCVEIKNRKKANPVETEAMKKAVLKEKINAIENAFREIPDVYRKGIWENIMIDKKYPLDADRSTYSRWKQRFIYQVCYNMNWI